MDIDYNPAKRSVTPKSYFGWYLLLVDFYSHFSVLIGLCRLRTQDVIEAIEKYRSQYVPGKQFQWGSLRCIRADAGSQFTSEEFKTFCTEAGFELTLAAPKHQHQNLAEAEWKSIKTLAFSFMAHARVGEAFTGLALEHAFKGFNCLPIQGLMDDSGAPTTPFFKFFGKKPKLDQFKVLFCPVVYKKYTSKKDGCTIKPTKSPQHGCRGIFVGIPTDQAGYNIFVPSIRQIINSQDVLFDENFTSAIAYTEVPYHDAMAV